MAKSSVDNEANRSLHPGSALPDGIGAWLDDLSTAVATSGVLQHPYLAAFAEGRMSDDHIRRIWLIQQAWLSLSFGSCMAEMLARVPFQYTEERRTLADIVSLETWGANPSSGHPKLFAQLAESLVPNISLDRLPEPLSSTREFISDRQDLMRSGSTFHALGVLTANEFLNADLTGNDGIMVRYQAGLTAMGYYPACGDYAVSHVAEEREDVMLLLRLTDRLANEVECGAYGSPPTFSEPAHLNKYRARDDFRQGTQDLCGLRHKYFDGLLGSCSLLSSRRVCGIPPSNF